MDVQRWLSGWSLPPHLPRRIGADPPTSRTATALADQLRHGENSPAVHRLLVVLWTLSSSLLQHGLDAVFVGSEHLERRYPLG